MKRRIEIVNTKTGFYYKESDSTFCQMIEVEDGVIYYKIGQINTVDIKEPVLYWKINKDNSNYELSIKLVEKLKVGEIINIETLMAQMEILRIIPTVVVDKISGLV